MADLMTDTYTYGALSGKYDHFCVPLVKIKRNGKDLVSTMKLTVSEITVTLSLDAANMAVFKVGGIYDEEKHSFDSKVKNAFSLGSIMEVELGYVSSSKNIFKGYVAMVGAEFSTAPFLDVTLMDVRRLMMVSGNRYMLHEVVNYSDAFHDVMKKYSRLCSLEIDATDDKLETPLSQVQNDYLFVTRELIQKGKVDREFFSLGGKVYFREPGKVKQPVMALRFGRELLALKVDEEYQDLKMEVIGYDAKAQKTVRGSAVVAKNSSQKTIIAATQVFALADPSADTQEKANTRAEKMAKEKRWKVCSGHGVTVGLPELVPGRFVRVEALEDDYGNHDFYMRSVSHTIRNGSFQTEFMIGGWV